jgi:hypothetical protein
MNAEQPKSGTVQGQTIQLDHPSGLADGTKVVVEIQPMDKSMKSECTCSSGVFWEIVGLIVDLADIFST